MVLYLIMTLIVLFCLYLVLIESVLKGNSVISTSRELSHHFHDSELETLKIVHHSSARKNTVASIIPDDKTNS